MNAATQMATAPSCAQLKDNSIFQNSWRPPSCYINQCASATFEVFAVVILGLETCAPGADLLGKISTNSDIKRGDY
jgi:hypothetical protein